MDLLKGEEFLPVLPPEVQAKRTIVMLYLDDHIYTKTENDITEELTNENSFLNKGIDNIYKIPKTKPRKPLKQDFLLST